jgi:hypothetical protein
MEETVVRIQIVNYKVQRKSHIYWDIASSHHYLS